jgi:RimJ/RimL family protein N-acetyltransferase
MIPTFRTERLIVRPRTLADTNACLLMDAEPVVTRFVKGPWRDPAAHRAFVESRTQGPYPPGLGYWTVTPPSEPETFLGWILLIPLDAIGPEVEIGWRFNLAAWGYGYATEAALPVLDHGLKRLGLKQIVADIDRENRASIRVALKLGLRPSTVLDSGLERYTIGPAV